MDSIEVTITKDQYKLLQKALHALCWANIARLNEVDDLSSDFFANEATRIRDEQSAVSELAEELHKQTPWENNESPIEP